MSAAFIWAASVVPVPNGLPPDTRIGKPDKRFNRAPQRTLSNVAAPTVSPPYSGATG